MVYGTALEVKVMKEAMSINALQEKPKGSQRTQAA